MLDNFIEKDEYEPCHRVYTHKSGNHIYLGDITAANDIQFLRAHHINSIVTASAQMDHLTFDPHMKHHVYELFDASSENMTKHFSSFYELMDTQLYTTNILVHCFAGISRSATLVISYFMKKHQWTFKQAIAEVRKFRPQVLPNLGFERQLKAYEKFLASQQSIQPSARKFVSKTSESRKHHQLKNNSIGLPEIMALGRTLGRSKIIPSDPLIGHPSSQMENRALRRIKLIVPQSEEDPKQFMLPGYSQGLPKRNPAVRSYRKRSISNTKNIRQEGKFLQDLQKDIVLEKPTIIQQKFILKQISFPTQKNIRRSGGP